MVLKQRFIELLSGKKSGSFSLPEQKELQELLSQYPDLADIHSVFEEIYKSDIYEHEPDDKIWQSVQQKITPEQIVVKTVAGRSMKLIALKVTAIAASLILAITLAAFFFNKPAGKNEKQNIVSTKIGSKTNLVLPDGSKVWLNADSKISYSDDFGVAERKITLKGEAYFDVVKDSEHPFVINTSALTLKVLGTAFNVRAYPGEKNTEAILIRGSLQITLHNNNKQVIVLKPNEKLAVQNEYSDTTVIRKQFDHKIPLVSISEIKKSPRDSVAIETQWVKNRLAFSDKKLEDVALQISRWFGVEVIIRGDELKNKEFSGLYNDQNLHQVMESLKLAGGFQFKIENNTVVIEP